MDRPPAPGYPLPEPPGRSRHRGPTGRAYLLFTARDGSPAIACDHCGRVSSHAQDVRWRYCGGSLCHTFLDAVPEAGPLLPPTFSDGIVVAQAVARARVAAAAVARRARGRPPE